MKKSYPDRLREIHFQVQKMNFSTDNMLEIILLFKESIKIAKKVNPHISKNACLKSLRNTEDSEFITFIAKNIKNEEEREEAFKEFKSNFLRDLSMNCFE